MIEFIKNYIIENRQIFSKHIKDAGNLRFFQYGASPRKIVFLIFTQGSLYPALCVKMVREKDNEWLLKKEMQSLEDIHAHYGDLRSSIPVFICLESIEGELALFQTAAAGKVLDSIIGTKWHFMNRSCVQGIFDIVGGWLIKFSKEAQKLTTIKSEQDKIKYLQSVTEQYKKSFVLSKTEDEKISGLIDTFQGRGIYDAHFYPQHGHFWPGNIFLKNDTINVVDWKDYADVQLPLYDPLLFCLTYGLKRYPGDPLKSFEWALFGKSWFSRLTGKQALAYCSACGADISLAGPLSALMLMRLASYARALHQPGKEDLSETWRSLLEFYFKNEERFLK
ncbi:MAG: hypothetical protein JW869_05025 [Candidatus Omnitrophica bacterium]|nr:hypothetical protein [Candidatus Omnitrophota bacterium]